MVQDVGSMLRRTSISSPSNCGAVISRWMDAVPDGTVIRRIWASENALKSFVAVQKLLKLFSASLQSSTLDFIPPFHTLVVTTCLLRLCVKDTVRTQHFCSL